MSILVVLQSAVFSALWPMHQQAGAALWIGETIAFVVTTWCTCHCGTECRWTEKVSAARLVRHETYYWQCTNNEWCISHGSVATPSRSVGDFVQILLEIASHLCSEIILKIGQDLAKLLPKFYSIFFSETVYYVNSTRVSCITNCY